MDLSSTENILYAAIAIGLVFALLAMIIQGWIMKLAVRFCGGDDIGIFYGISALTLSSLAGVAASTTMIIMLPGSSPLIAVLASVAGSTIMLCLMLRMGPIRAFAVYLTQGFLSFIAIALLAGTVMAGVYFLVPSETIEQLASEAKTRVENVNPAAFSSMQNGENGEISEFGENGEIKVQGIADLQKLLNGFTGSSASPETPLGDNSGNLGSESKGFKETLSEALFGKGEVDCDLPAQEDQKRVPPSKKVPVKADPLQSPYDNRIRSNPFVD